MIPYNRDMSFERVIAVALSWSLISIAGIGPLGCRSPENRGGITSPYPLDRVRAAVACAESGDPEAVDLLIEMLDDNDRGVRMYSILALERLCGENFGYRYYASDSERAEAVARWRAARLHGKVHLAPTGGDSAETVTSSAAQGGEMTAP